MAGDVSRDFSRLLSDLHKEVVGLKKIVSKQSSEIEALRKQVDNAEDKTVKRQASKVRRAILNGDENDRAAAMSLAQSVADEELLKAGWTDFEMEMPVINVNPELLSNFITSFQAGALPKPAAVFVEETKPVYKSYLPTPENPEIVAARQAVEHQRRLFAERQALQRRDDENALGRLSSRTWEF